MNSKINSFSQYWPKFLKEHSKPLTRRWHFWSFLMVSLAPFFLFLKGSGPAFILLVAGIVLSWYSHFIIQENKPTSWGNPVWAARGNLKMVWLMVTSGLEQELKKHEIESKS